MNSQDLATAKVRNYCWKISTARHTLKSLFLARHSGKVADSWAGRMSEQWTILHQVWQTVVKSMTSVVICQSMNQVEWGFCDTVSDQLRLKRMICNNIKGRNI